MAVTNHHFVTRDAHDTPACRHTQVFPAHPSFSSCLSKFCKSGANTFIFALSLRLSQSTYTHTLDCLRMPRSLRARIYIVYWDYTWLLHFYKHPNYIDLRDDPIAHEKSTWWGLLFSAFRLLFRCCHTLFTPFHHFPHVPSASQCVFIMFCIFCMISIFHWDISSKIHAFIVSFSLASLWLVFTSAFIFVAGLILETLKPKKSTPFRLFWSCLYVFVYVFICVFVCCPLHLYLKRSFEYSHHYFRFELTTIYYPWSIDIKSFDFKITKSTFWGLAK